MENKKTYYFLGIGGIGMSAIARYFNAMGHKVSGYDRTTTALTKQLEAEGIAIHYTPNIELIPKDVDMVIYTPAIPTDNEEYVYITTKNIPIKKRAQVLGEITANKKCIAVAGSHGKTTTSGMIAYILSKSKVGCSAFLGGIVKNFDSNVIINAQSEYIVVEADEYDRSFHQLYPTYSIITATDPDHLDIYQTHKNLIEAFKSTLESALNCDLALVVCDATGEYDMQLQTTLQTLKDMEFSSPYLVVMNKSEGIRDNSAFPYGSICISAKEKLGLDGLRREILRRFKEEYLFCELFVPYAKVEDYTQKKRFLTERKVEYAYEGQTVIATIPARYGNLFEEYIKNLL